MNKRLEKAADIVRRYNSGEPFPGITIYKAEQALIADWLLKHEAQIVAKPARKLTRRKAKHR